MADSDSKKARKRKLTLLSPRQLKIRKEQEYFPFLWVKSYTERAQLVIVKRSTREKASRMDANVQVVFDDRELPRMAIFKTLHPPDTTPVQTEYLIMDRPNDNIHFCDINESELIGIMKELNVNCGLSVNTSEVSNQWTQLIDHLEACTYTLPHLLWKREEIPDMQDFMKKSVSTLCQVYTMIQRSFESDMSNGDGKEFIEALIEFIKTELVKNWRGKVLGIIPVLNSKINGYIEYVSADNEYDEETVGQSRSSASSDASYLYANPERCKVVSDYVVILAEYPGRFLLNFELKNSKENWEKANVQCVRQMLTQMHFQEVAIGVVMSSVSWALLIMRKVDNKKCKEISIHRYQEQFAIGVRSATCGQTLNCKALTSLCNWIYRIIDWGVNINKKS